MTSTVRNEHNTTKLTLEPVAVGRYLDAAGVAQLLAFSREELKRSTQFYMERLGRYHLPIGTQVLMISLFDESNQFAPLRDCLKEFGLVMLNSDASYFDAARAESSLRRYSVRVVIGINQTVLKGLRELGHDPAKVLDGAIVWARPDAYQELLACSNFETYLWSEVGPAVAMECSNRSGAHIDRIEWAVESVNGEIVLSSRLARSEHFEQYATGVLGSVDHSTCGCGSSDPRILLAPMAAK